VAHYRAILEAARQAGVEPWVCLHHFTLPRWFADDGGFLVPANRVETWARHVDFVAETFGELVAGWQPVNEPNYYALLAYGGDGWPPGHDDPAERDLVDEAIHLATAEAAVRLRGGGAPVASIFGLSPAVPMDDDPSSLAAAQAHHDRFWVPGLGLFRDGVLRVPGREPVQREDLASAFDLMGFSYYATVGFRRGRAARYPDGATASPLGYGVFPDGLGLVLDRLHAELPDTPLLVAEYGIGTDDDEERSRYLQRGLEITRAALTRGVDVRGFFHWTAVDNYEWRHGYDVRFGLIDAERVVKPSAAVLGRAAGVAM
jgi:beta-glucosidase